MQSTRKITFTRVVYGIGGACVGLVVALLVFLLFVPGKPQLTTSVLIKNLGVLSPGAELKDAFEITNSGSSPLIIKELRSSCSCTEAEASNTVVEPGKTERLKITFITPDRRGVFENEVAMLTNDPERPVVHFAIRAEIVPAVQLQPETMDFGLVSHSELPQTIQAVILLDKNRQDLEESKGLLQAQATLEHLSVQIKEMPGTGDKQLQATLHKNSPLGPINGRIVITYPENGSKKQLEISVLGQVRGAIVVKPNNVLLAPGIRTRESQTVVVKNDPVNYKIKSIQPSKSLKDIINVEMINSASETALCVSLKQNMDLKSPSPTDKIEGIISIWFESPNKEVSTSSKVNDNAKVKFNEILRYDLPVVVFLARKDVTPKLYEASGE